MNEEKKVRITIDHELRLKMEEVGRLIADTIDNGLPEGIGFALLLFEYNEIEGQTAWMSYTSNCERKAMVSAMQEFIDNNKEGQQEIVGPLSS